MPGESPDIHGIQTPVELDAYARDTLGRLERNPSPLIRFHTLTYFLRGTAHLPPSWLSSYYRSIYPILSVTIRHEYVRWMDPDDWQVMLAGIDRMRMLSWTAMEETLRETEETAWKKCALTLAGQRAFRTLHALLHARGIVDIELSDDEWSGVLNAGTMAPDAFHVYRDTLARHGRTPVFLQRALEAWDHARTDAVRPGVILMDAQDNGAHPIGIALHLEVSAQRGAVTRIHFRNALDADNSETMQQLAHAAIAAAALVDRHFGHATPSYEWHIGFHEHEAAYAGESMGLTAGLAMVFRMQQEFNAARRWLLRPHLVCTGGLDAAGNVHPLPDDVVDGKVRVAFFSPADVLVLPARNIERARRIVLALRQRFPDRPFDLYGVDTLDDCVRIDGIIRIDQRSVYARTMEFARARGVLLLTALVFLVAAAGVYFWWKSHYGYPDLEFATGAPIEENALVFNPHREADWQFRDFDRVLEPVLPFGDLEVGADATRNVYLWNMTPGRLDVALAIEGPQADQWYISWHGGVQSVTPTDSLRVMIKYAPTHAAERNEAVFTVRDPESGALHTRLALVGSAGPPLPAGSALSFDGIDDMLFFGQRAIAFARDEGTIEFWFRLDADQGCFFSNNRNIPQAPAIENMAFSHHNDTLFLEIGNSLAVLPLGERRVAGSGRWHHVAIAFSRRAPSIVLMLDGAMLLNARDEFLIEAYTDPFVTFGAYHNEVSVQSPFRGAMDELRVWDRALPADTIRARMRTRVHALTPGLLGCWDFDIISEVAAHNANERTQDGLLRGRPTPIRSAVPLTETTTPGIRRVRGPSGAAAVELQANNWLQCGRDVIDASAARSYAIRFRHDHALAGVIMSVVNQDAYLVLAPTQMLLAGRPVGPHSVRDGWNTAVFRVDAQQTVTLFLNGEKLSTVRSEDFRRGPTYRYEGLQVGIFNDKYNMFGPKSFDHMYTNLQRRLAVTDFRVWRRAL
ncbi:MAG: LamG domain-containing protein, partial [Bacteroidota bacterium]|nr:LamG domain-containing protein [Bacteroidota bacterium]